MIWQIRSAVHLKLHRPADRARFLWILPKDVTAAMTEYKPQTPELIQRHDTDDHVKKILTKRLR